MARLKVVVKPGNSLVEVEAPEEGITVKKLLERLGLSTESAIVMVDGRVAPEWHRVKPGENIVVYRAISSG